MRREVNIRGRKDPLKTAFESKNTVWSCMVCNSIHDPLETNNESFVTFAGDVYVGIYGGMIGGNFDAFGQLNRVMICCRKDKCLQQVVRYLLDKKASLTLTI